MRLSVFYTSQATYTYKLLIIIVCSLRSSLLHAVTWRKVNELLLQMFLTRGY